MVYVFCATKGKPKIAEQLLRNLFGESSCNIIFIVGQSWDEFRTLTAVRDELKSERISVYFEPYSPSFSYSINAGWGRLRYQLGTDRNILGLATADDHVYYQDWDKKVLKCYHEQFPEQDGLMFLHVLGPTGQGAPGWTGPCVVSAKFCDLYMGGWLVPPYYHCNAIDTEYAGVAKLHGKRERCLESVVKHLLHDWKRTENSEQRKMGIATAIGRGTRGYKYDILAPWRYWK